MTKWVYGFGGGRNEGNSAMRDLLGGKGANLAEMSRIGIPVPPGFTITTEMCTAFTSAGNRYPEELDGEVRAALGAVETATGLRFGDPDAPLLVSVRSGARVSMPGMMDTILNLGLNDLSVEGLARSSGDPRFAWDSYRRFMQMYGSVVLGVPHHYFEEVIEHIKIEADVLDDTALAASHWQEVVGAYKDLVLERTGQPFPQDAVDQLWGAIGAVFNSWMTPRANTYRRLNDIPVTWGTAVNVQAMVFGNMGDDCATGVCFTRDPSTGENVFYGEFLINAQGEDVVAGIRTPQPMTENGTGDVSMERALPEAYAELVTIRRHLETHYHDMQDVEFTVQRNKLYILQTRSGKRTAAAALRIAVEMAGEGLITREEAVARVSPASLDQLLHPALDPAAERKLLTTGLPASPGAASGAIVFDADEVELRASRGEAVILVRTETSPEDIHGMHAARGVLTARGGMTSHAAVVARGMGRPCIAGAGALQIDATGRTMQTGGIRLAEGDWITIDGGTGEVFLGRVPTVDPVLGRDFDVLLGWADAMRALRIRANADTPDDAAAARRFGAEGIGLCRTEHMFFAPDRIGLVRRMIMASNDEARGRALVGLLPFQRDDFAALFRAMAGLPVTIRLLDPPLHEFLPHEGEDLSPIAEFLGETVEAVQLRRAALSETNPMLGHRGCRLGISFPAIYAMQVRAIVEAALLVAAETGGAETGGAETGGAETGAPLAPEIMIPLIATEAELRLLRGEVERVAAAVFAEQGATLPLLIGTMIELPRAALTADRIAAHADFFSFGTNDLTQTTFGMSRDDAGSFLPGYLDRGILERDPFAHLDRDGVGELVAIGARKGRGRRPDLKLGVCGEHGGDPASIAFCDEIGLDYVSCSPFRVPIARLAAAQAALRRGKGRPGA